MLPELIKLNTDPAVVTSKTGYVVACEKEGNFYVCIHGGFRLQVPSLADALCLSTACSTSCMWNFQHLLQEYLDLLLNALVLATPRRPWARLKNRFFSSINCFEWEIGMRIWKVIRRFLNHCYSLPRLLFAFSLIYRLLIHLKPVQSWISINNLCVFEWSILSSVYISVRYLRSDIHHYLS